MNIHEYISSGILEAYAMGELSEQERLEVENNLMRFPELREELALIEDAQEELLMRAAIKPRSLVKDQLFAKIDGQDLKPEAKIVSLNVATDATSGNVWKWAAAASIAVAVLSSYLAFSYRAQLTETRNELGKALALNQRMADQYNQVNQRLDQIENDLDVTTNPDFTRVAMTKAPTGTEGSLATVYWNQKTQEVYLDVDNLKEISKDNQFQLWAIIDGKPVDAGVFDADVAGLIKMKQINSGAIMFAVTIEPRGGKESPSLETMQVAGQVKG